MGTFQVNDLVADVFLNPVLEPVRNHFFFAPQDTPAPAGFENARISDLAQIGWSAQGVTDGLNCLYDSLADGRVSVHPIYDPEECRGDAQKKDVSLIYMAPKHRNPSLPHVILCAGGGYTVVCSVVEAFPTARHFLDAGYPVFLLSYRVARKPAVLLALEDLAQAVRWLSDHAGGFGIDPARYAIGGFSAGANLICNWGLPAMGYAAHSLPKPLCMFPIYAPADLGSVLDPESAAEMAALWMGDDWKETKETFNVTSRVDADYPPCYIVCGKDDATVPPENSERLAAALAAAGVPVKLEEGDHAAHGFGDGTGTDVEGWPERAMAFLESLL